jgi:hypothetical protein
MSWVITHVSLSLHRFTDIPDGVVIASALAR